MPDAPRKPRVLFYRRLLKPDSGTNGGNLKLRDCYNHFLHSDRWEPRVYFSPDTVWHDTPGHHWADLREDALETFDPQPGDLLFLSGHDWSALDGDPPVPVLNIAQPRHARRADPRRDMLGRPAIRIAKSEAGAKILREFGVNGPLFVVPDAIDRSLLPPVPAVKDIDVLIPGLKEPELAHRVHTTLSEWNEEHRLGLNIHLQSHPKLPERGDFLELVARSRIIACIPLSAERGAEGFYLPALEAMGLETLVVCPLAVGNRGHCLDGVNCLVPDYDAADIVAATKRAVALPPEERERLLAGGRKTAADHGIGAERRAILDLADRAYELWRREELFRPEASFHNERASPVEKVGNYVRSLPGLFPSATFAELETLVQFVGYPRSGHTLIGSLLDAHPDIVMAHEMDSLYFYDHGYTAGQVFQLLLDSSRRFTRSGREWMGYDYRVPEQWHGRYRTLRVLGDKSGGRTARRIQAAGNLSPLSGLLEKTGQEKVFIHVIRNPYDVITTMMKRTTARRGEAEIEAALLRKAGHFFRHAEGVRLLKAGAGYRVIDVYHEDFVGDARNQLRRLVEELGLSAPDDYLEAAAGLVWPTARRSRGRTDLWTARTIANVAGRMERYEWFGRYAYERTSDDL